jgi:hypothetical protein
MLFSIPGESFFSFCFSCAACAVRREPVFLFLPAAAAVRKSPSYAAKDLQDNI